MMKKTTMALTALTFAFTTQESNAIPVDTTNFLEFTDRKIIGNPSPPVGGAIWSTSLDGNPGIGTTSQGFSGEAIATASANIGESSQSQVQSEIQWAYEFTIARPGARKIRVDYTYGAAFSVFTNGAGLSNTLGFVADLRVDIVKSAFHQWYSWDPLAIAGLCVSALDVSCTDGDSDTKSMSNTFSYSPGYAVGTKVTLSGVIETMTSIGTGYEGTAVGIAGAETNFLVAAVPAPSSLSLLLIGITSLLGLSQRKCKAD